MANFRTKPSTELTSIRIDYDSVLERQADERKYRKPEIAQRSRTITEGRNMTYIYAGISMLGLAVMASTEYFSCVEHMKKCEPPSMSNIANAFGFATFASAGLLGITSSCVPGR